MGYSHYWWRPEKLQPRFFKSMINDFRRVLPLIKERGIELAGWDGNGEPELTASTFAFNGKGKDHCETFRLDIQREKTHIDNSFGGTFVDTKGPKPLYISFCKTNRHNYDFAVMVALIIFKRHFDPLDRKLVRVTSDGGEEEWREAIEFCKKHLGYGLIQNKNLGMGDIL